MMNRIADFMLISEEHFRKDLDSLGLCASYEDISLPKRATSGSAGYDFYLPMDITLEPGEEMTVKLVKQGKDASQAIGYLDDGTMIVAEDGRKMIGQTTKITVTSVLQTSAGRMIFGRLKH